MPAVKEGTYRDRQAIGETNDHITRIDEANDSAHLTGQVSWTSRLGTANQAQFLGRENRDILLALVGSSRVRGRSS